MAPPNEWDAVATRYVAHFGTLPGVVRQAVVLAQLLEHLPAPPAAVLDVGGGGGHISVPLAELGYDVVVVDPSRPMLDVARAQRAALAASAPGRVRLVQGALGDQWPLTPSATFDAVLCHGVLMYLPDIPDAVRRLARLTRPAGALSIVTKHSAALALRPALQGDYGGALAALGETRTEGWLGMATQGVAVPELTELLATNACTVTDWFGVGVLTDHRVEEPVPPEVDVVVAAEVEAGRRDPYRQVSRLVHVVATRDDAAR